MRAWKRRSELKKHDPPTVSRLESRLSLSSMSDANARNHLPQPDIVGRDSTSIDDPWIIV